MSNKKPFSAGLGEKRRFSLSHLRKSAVNDIIYVYSKMTQKEYKIRDGRVATVIHGKWLTFDHVDNGQTQWKIKIPITLRFEHADWELNPIKRTVSVNSKWEGIGKISGPSLRAEKDWI